jgi:zinc-ribbon domain
MAAQYCMSCGQPVPAGAGFCPSCGAAVATAAPGPTAPSAAPSAPTSAGPPLESVLGLQGHRYFLLQHELISAAHTYRVLDRDKHRLFTVQEAAHTDEAIHFDEPAGGPRPGIHLVHVSPGHRTSEWTVLDAGSNVQGSVSVQIQGQHAVSSLTDAAGAAVVFVDIEKSGFDSLTATAAYPDGRPMFEVRGTVLSHNFSIHAPNGPELAKVHEAWASARDTYVLEIVGPVDHLAPLIFAILIDIEKEGSPHPGPGPHHPGPGRSGFTIR